MKDSKVKKMKAPFKLLISITDRGVGKDLELYLTQHDMNGGVLFMGKGTAESNIADIFGFGISDKDVLACLIPIEKLSQTVHDFNEITGIERDGYGLLFEIDVSSASSNLMELLNISVGE